MYRCKELYTKLELERVQAALHIPDQIRGKNRSVFSGMEGLCVLLHRLSFSCRLCDLEPIFGCGKAELSIIVNTMLPLLYNEWNHLFTNIAHHRQHWLTQERMEEACAAVQGKGSPLPNVWGFVDGTIRRICRPRNGQRLFYNEHKRIHGLQFQSVVTPFGIVVHLYGPVEGKRHDASMLRESGLLDDLQQSMQ